MDPARRWQVASAVTAAAGLGLGAIVMQRPSVEVVEPIQLEVVDRAAAREALVPVAPVTPDREAFIVTPDLSERLPTPPSAASPASLDSPDTPPGSPAGPPSVTRSPSVSPSVSPSPTPSPSPTTTPPPAPPEPDSPDSPASVDSPASIDT